MQRLIWGIIPQFGNMTEQKRDECEERLVREFESLREKYDFEFRPITLRPASELTIQNITFEFPAEVSKGIAVRLALTAILWSIDVDRGPLGRKFTWIVMVDGTGAYVSQLESILKGFDRSSLVLGKRAGKYWGMPDRRKKIEFFEKYLLKYKINLSTSLPDCQAGIWGFRSDLLEYLPLTAYDYGLEFDLTTCALTKYRRRPHFVKVVADPDRAASTFSGRGSEDESPNLELAELNKSINKLKLIIELLDLTREDIRVALDTFGGILPEKYKSKLRVRLKRDNAIDPLFSPKT